MLKHFALAIPIKPEFAQQYIDLHRNPWKEMLVALKEAEFEQEIIYFFNHHSIVFFECTDYEYSDSKVRATEICKRWDETVCPWFAGTPFMLEQIFDLNRQLSKALSDE